MGFIRRVRRRAATNILKRGRRKAQPYLEEARMDELTASKKLERAEWFSRKRKNINPKNQKELLTRNRMHTASAAYVELAMEAKESAWSVREKAREISRRHKMLARKIAGKK